ncbi:MAG: glycosyltransferase family 39 protein [Acidobacteriia bacterium]|nr:glycosyltransferase family 39 protein [Terriglobia bacterium]
MQELARETAILPPATSSAGIRHTLAGAVLLALVLRLVVVAFLYPGQLNPRADHWPFGYETGRIARAIASGRGFSDPLFPGTGPTAWMGPVYPYLAAEVFKLCGIFTKASAIVLLSLDSLFSAFTCVPIFFIARRCFGQKTANAAAWGWALFPYAVLLSAGMIWDMCLTTLLLALLLWISLELERTQGPAPWIGFGLLAGVTALTNPTIAILFPVLAGYACYRRSSLGIPGWRKAVIFATLAVVVVLLPWEVRNYSAFHRLVPLRDNFWLEVWIGNNGDTSFWTEQAAHPFSNPTEAEQFRRLGETRYMEKKKSDALAFIAAHPGWVARQTLRRVSYTWTGFWGMPEHPIREDFDADEPFDPAFVVFCTGMTVLMIIGLRRAFRNQLETRWLFVAALVTIPFVYYITRPHARYRHPLDPLIVMAAAYALTGRKDSDARAQRKLQA